MTGTRVAIVGAGLMGTGLAYSFAARGDDVRIYDLDGGALARATKEIARISNLFGTAPPEVLPCRDLASAVRSSDLVIEAAVENAAVKREIFATVSEATAPETLLATNTSSIPLRELVPAVIHPGRLVGAHFWNPPYAVRLVEVVEHPQVSPDALTEIVAILQAADFIPVVVHSDIPGLIGNRLQHALKREAIALVAQGVCDAETVDTVAKLTIGRRLAVLGPLEQSDLVGLDLTLAIHETLMPDLDRTDHPHPYLVSLVEEGRLGMKTGRGFRSWTPEQAEAVRRRLEHHVLAGVLPPGGSGDAPTE
jgi:3-hydroxybutyryl-CoA dehydrogenase